MSNADIVDYIGISKLSCYLCETIIKDAPHRGVHGLLYWYNVAEIILNNPKLYKKLVKDLKYHIKHNPDIFGPAKIFSVDDFINAMDEQIMLLKQGHKSVQHVADLSTDHEIEVSIPYELSEAPDATSLLAFNDAVGLVGDLTD